MTAGMSGYAPHSLASWRAWECWANRGGCGDLIGKAGEAGGKMS